MCYLRGVLMTRLNRHDRAKEHFMEALSLDVKCFDAFHELTNGNLLGVDEGTRRSGTEDFLGSRAFSYRVGLCRGLAVHAADTRGCGLCQVGVSD